MAKKTVKKTVSKADAKAIVKVVKGEKAKAKGKAQVAAKLTDAAAAAGIVRVKRPSVVAVDTAKREKLTNKSDRYSIESVVDGKGRDFWVVKLDDFFVAEFNSIGAAKAAYPNGRILGGQGCAESVKGLPQAKPAAPAAELKPAVAKAWELPPESPEDRLARLKAAARKAWETRRLNGWKHPKAAAMSPETADLMKRADAQLAQSKENVKQARETTKAIDAKKAEKRKALAVVKRVEKREADKRKGQPVGIDHLKKIMAQAIGLN